MHELTHLVSNGDGWRLAVKQTYNPDTLDRSRRPLLIVPGYGMNAFIFGYHPHGRSMEETLADAGFEVWSVNFRGQGESKREPGGKRSYGFREISMVDLPLTVDFVLANTESERERLDIIGASLGGTYVYLYAALVGADKLGSIVGLGAPFRWVEIHPVLRVAFGSPRLAGMLKLRHTRAIARLALPILKHAPCLLSIYIHPEISDISKAEILTRTVEDPNPVLNREISTWIINKDLLLDGRNLTDEMAAIENPMLCILCNADGIVPPATATAALDASSARVKDALTVGSDAVPMAHADLYISDHSEAWVFKPLIEWLVANG